MFLDALELHVLKRTIVFVLVELGFEKLSDRLKGLVLELLSCCNKLVMVVFMKRHVNYSSASTSKGFGQLPASRALAIQSISLNLRLWVQGGVIKSV